MNGNDRGMTQNNELILQLCKFIDPDADLIKELLQSGPNWAYVLGQLMINRMAGAAYKTLSDTNFTGVVNREFRNALKIAYNENKRRNFVYRESLKELGNLERYKTFVCGVERRVFKRNLPGRTTAVKRRRFACKWRRYREICEIAYK